MGNLSCQCISEQSGDNNVEVEEIGRSKLAKESKFVEMTIDMPAMAFSLNITELAISQSVLSVWNYLPPFTYDNEPKKK